jgi:hypothetical protein
MAKVTLEVAEQELASNTVAVYVVTPRLCAVVETSPELQLYVNNPTPPFAVTAASPSTAPLQLT